MGNIVWIASYPKSGNTWVRVFIENYLRNQKSPVDINSIHETSLSESSAFRYLPYLKEGQDLTELTLDDVSSLRPRVQADIARGATGTTFVKSHNYMGEYGGYPLHNASVTAGAIYIVRNPLDVAVSLARYFGFSIDESIDFMAEEMTGTPPEAGHVPQIITSWSLHVASWTRTPDPAMLVLRYEDMIDDPRKSFRKVESLMGLPKNPARLKNAIRHASFSTLKSLEESGGFIERHENASRFFAKGKKNQWREVLSDAQVERIVSSHREQMARFKYLPG